MCVEALDKKRPTQLAPQGSKKITAVVAHDLVISTPNFDKKHAEFRH